MPETHPFDVGDKVRIAALPEPLSSQMAVTVLDVGTCDVEDGCDKPTISFNDPESGALDEAHAEEFVLVERAS